MNGLLDKILTEFNNRSTSEQWIVTFFLMVVIFFVWLFVMAAPLSRMIKANTMKNNSAEKNLLNLRTQYDHYQSIHHSPTDVFKEKIEFLNLQLKQLEQDSLLNKKLIASPADLQNVLQAISKTSAMISLNQVQKISLTPIEGVKKIALSKQKIMVEFTGNYFDTVRYLNYLENLPWYISFDSLDYQVDAYPNAKVKLIFDVLTAG